MTTFADALQRVMWGKVGSQKLSNLTRISKSKIDSWLQGRVHHPRDWRLILTIAQALLLTREDTDILLLAAGHAPIADLEALVPPNHPDRHYLQPWLTAMPLSPSACHQLRAPVGDFVGRAAEIATLRAALLRASDSGGSAAISGVQGMGGIGKTELAYAVAQQVRHAFPDAQIVLPLQGASSNPLSPTQALQMVIRAFTPDAKLPDDLPMLEALYRTRLNTRRVLILADDASDAAQVRVLLPPAGCALLVTSRTRFALPAMTTIDLNQLPLPENIQLLRAICPRLTTNEALALAQICGSLPLALRVSGSLLHTTPALPVADYLTTLADERQRLARLRDPDDRHLDVEASLMLSYTQLDAGAQAVFRQLGVLVADFAMPLAQAVVVVPAGDVTTTLYHLQRRNLVLYDSERRRWRLHNLVRDLARQRLAATGEADAVRWRYARAAVTIAQEAQNQYLTGGNDIRAALARFDTERPHINAGYCWAAAHAGMPNGDQLILEAATIMRAVGRLRYDIEREGIPLLEQAQAAAQRLGEQREEGRALGNLGTAYRELGKMRYALPYFVQALSIFRSLGERRLEGLALTSLGTAYHELGEEQSALPYFVQALSIFRSLDDRQGQELALCGLGRVYAGLGELHSAIAYYEQELVIARDIGDRRDEGCALTNLGDTYTDLGDTRRAITTCEEALIIVRDIGDRRTEGYTLSYLARAQALHGNLPVATSSFTQALALFRETGNRQGAAECRWLFGLALAQHGRRERALPLLRAALAYWQEIRHANASDYAALLARVETGEALPAQQHPPLDQRAVGATRTEGDEMRL